jgi:tetratricopeptide (TPR) repeat protein
MQRGMTSRLRAGVVVGVLGALLGGLGTGAAEAPPAPPAKLDSRQQAELSRLEGRLTKELAEGAFAKAVETARQIAALRERWQGGRHGESVAAREAVHRYQALLRLPEKDQQEVAKSFRAEAEGEALARKHQYRAADGLYRQALALRLKVLGAEHPDTATSYNNVAVNLDDQGKYGEAQPLKEKALAIRRQVLGEEHPDTATGYNNLAYNLKAQGRYAAAQPLYEKALAIDRQVLGEDHPDTARSYHNVASNLAAQGQHAAAQPLYEKALAIFRQVLGEEHPHTATCYNNVAFNLHAQGRYAAAQPLFEKALAIKRQALGEDHPSTALGYNHLAINLWQQHRIGPAVRLLQASLPGQEAARFHRAASGFDRAVAAGKSVSPHALLALGLARLGRPADAFGHAEASLARGLLDDLTAATTDEARQAASLRTLLGQLDRRLLPLFGRATRSAEQQALRAELVRQRRQALSRLARLAADVSARQLLPLADIREHLPAEAALVLWLDVDPLGERQACIVRPKGAPAWVRLTGSGQDGAWTAADRDLPERLYRLLQRPTSPEGERRRLSAALRRQRLEPLRPHLGAGHGLPAVRQLLVVPAGWAGRVPLEALATGYRVSYVPSGSVYARLQQQHRPVDGSSLLALGDPVFTAPATRRPEPPPQGVLLSWVQPGGSAGGAGLRAGDVLLRLGGRPLTSPGDLKKALAGGGSVRYWRAGEEHSTKVPAGPLGVRLDGRPAPEAVAAWRAAESSPVARGADPVPLPGTRWEVRALGRLVPKTTALLGSEASEQRLDELARDGQLKGYRLIHLATHGLVDGQTPGRSRLLLARDRLPDPLEQSRAGRKVYTGELTVSAIRSGWALDADLVVLSACRTALGREGGGDGLLGFAQAFLQGGARCVVLSRWEADDRATALLMLRFYENVLGSPARKGLKGPLPRAEALAEARRWLRELPRRDAEALAAALRGGQLGDTVTRGTVVELDVRERPVKLPAGERPYAHPFYWATFVLVGDPE